MSFVFWLVVLFVVIMVTGVIALLRYRRERVKKMHSDKVLFIKENGKELKVHFASCEIVHREYFEEGTSRGTIKKDISIITFQTEKIDGVNRLFKTLPVFLPAEKLREKINTRRKTIIYYNPADPEIYYFDVEFLLAFMNNP